MKQMETHTLDMAEAMLEPADPQRQRKLPDRERSMWAGKLKQALARRLTLARRCLK